MPKKIKIPIQPTKIKKPPYPTKETPDNDKTTKEKANNKDNG